jgi:hypothetical protein
VKPPLEEILSLHDFEAVARRTMNRRGWNYYSSGADDEITMVDPLFSLPTFCPVLIICRGRIIMLFTGEHRDCVFGRY